ncbi:hypothetical protein [Bacillus sp. ISL-57]|uniref:hypothetical protein n=1 Tax=Bacillus sp. ISL-57 TaxID=2819135 RepID=UPI001BE73CA1|nr:hypothetical protein [Bacillus sp. ISL-57]MBT2718061.1 hypothetical protein [Bacillus sp. ISL-57]
MAAMIRKEVETGIELIFTDDDITTKRKIVMNIPDNTVIIYDWIDTDLQVVSLSVSEFMTAACELVNNQFIEKLA